jgi:hypothetical protein
LYNEKDYKKCCISVFLNSALWSWSLVDLSHVCLLFTCHFARREGVKWLSGKYHVRRDGIADQCKKIGGEKQIIHMYNFRQDKLWTYFINLLGDLQNFIKVVGFAVYMEVHGERVHGALQRSRSGDSAKMYGHQQGLKYISRLKILIILYYKSTKGFHQSCAIIVVRSVGRVSILIGN